MDDSDSVEVSDDVQVPAESEAVLVAVEQELERDEAPSTLQLPTFEQPERSMSMDGLPSVAAYSTPAGSPTNADVSRAGRKRKANAKYMEEPSPVLKPVVRKSISSSSLTASNRKSAPVQPPPPTAPAATRRNEKKEEAIVVTGPPTFGSLLFGHKSGRKLSESLSDLDLDEEEEEEEYELPEIVSEEDEPEPVVSRKSSTTLAKPSKSSDEPVGMIGVGEPLPGPYFASGAAGPTFHGLTKPPLVPPSEECSIKFPDISSEEFQASLPPRIPIPIELSGGGVFSLLPNAPLMWFRDEVPRLSAYFRKKMEAAGGVVPKKEDKPQLSATEKKAAALTTAQREERRRQKEEERKRLIEERNRRRERERLKQLYRQHWLALTKFPIEDDLLHSHKGIRRLGHPPVQARLVASPAIYWDCRLGPPETLEIPSSAGPKVTELVDEIFVVWNFFVHFHHLVGGVRRFTLPQLVEGVVSRSLTPLMEDVYMGLLQVLEPWVEWQITTYLQAEQGLESQLTKNRGRAKMHWSSICQFRDLMFLGYSVLIQNRDKSKSADNWLWRALFVAKAGVLLESIDYRTKDFLATISAAFEEIDFEHKWIFDWELERSWTFEQFPFEYRVKLLKLLIDRIVTLPVVKKSVDLLCESRTHVSAEITAIDKEERKLTQRITLCQKLQSIIAQAPNSPEAATIQMPMTEEELVQETALRDALVRSKRTSTIFFDNELAVRLETLGRDRHMNEYFQISSDRRFVFVRQHSVSHPNVVRYGIYDSLANIEQLIQSLDDRGVRELALKTELQKTRTTLYQETVAANVTTKFDTFTIDWLGSDYHCHASNEANLDQLDEDATKYSQLKYLRDCVEKTRTGFERIQKAWTGKLSSLDDDDDDATIDEGTMDNDDDDASMDADSSNDQDTESPRFFVAETDKFYNSILTLSQTITECIRNSLLGYTRPDETTSTTSSILIQFHIKTGQDLLRHLSIPIERNEFTKFLVSVDPHSSKSMLQAASAFLDGLEALDEIVHAEVARHEAAITSIEIWPATGGEKHAWKQFISARIDSGRQEAISPVGEGEEEAAVTPEQEDVEDQHEERRDTSSMFGCDNCGKKFKFHILLGLHKLHPCKTRGRKPLPVDPVMEVLPVPTNNGVVAIETVSSVDFPPLPSTRQEAVERADRAERAERAAAAAAAAGSEINAEGLPAVVSASTTEFVCEICGKGFPHNQGLAVHQTRWCIPEQQAQLLLTAQQAVGGVPIAPPSLVVEEGPVNCPTCGKTFPTVQGLSIHQTRWCKGPEQGETKAETHTNEDDKRLPFESIKSIHVEPVFRKIPVSQDELVRVDEIATASDVTTEEVSQRQPGFTPACYSLAAISVAYQWYTCKLEKALAKFNSDRSHHSRSASSKSMKSRR